MLVPPRREKIETCLVRLGIPIPQLQEYVNDKITVVEIKVACGRQKIKSIAIHEKYYNLNKNCIQWYFYIIN